MSRPRGKLVALAMLPVALVVAGFALWPLAQEEWFLRRLESGDEAERQAAAKRLAEMGSVRAVPGLVRILKEKSHVWGERFGSGQVLIPIFELTSDLPLTSTLVVDRATASTFDNALRRLLGPRAVPCLIDLLADESDPVALWAISSLAAHGRRSDAALRALAATLQGGNENRRCAAATALGGFGAAAVPPLVGALGDANARLRIHAADALDEIGADAKAAIPALVERLADREEVVRTQAAVVLVELGADIVPLLVARLDDEELNLCLWALSLLKDMGPEAAAAVPALAKALSGSGDSIALLAMAALEAIGPAASPALPELMEVLRRGSVTYAEFARGLARIGPASVPVIIAAWKGSDAGSRSCLAHALGRIGPEAKAGVPLLAEALAHGDPYLRKVAAISLREIGPDARDAAPALVQAILSGSPQLRVLAAAAIARLDPSSNAGIPILVEALSSEVADVAYTAVEGLGKVGPDAASAIPVLLEAHNKGRFVEPSVIALARMGSAAVPAIEKLLQHYWGRRAVLSGLAEAGADARHATPALVRALSDPDERNRASAVLALGAIGPDARTAAPALVERLKLDDLPLEITSALQSIGPGALPPILPLLKESRPDWRQRAALALAGMGPGAKEAVPELIDALRDSEPEVRSCAARALSNIGPAARPALPALAALRDRDSALALTPQAQAILRRIRRGSDSPKKHVHRWREWIDGWWRER